MSPAEPQGRVGLEVGGGTVRAAGQRTICTVLSAMAFPASEYRGVRERIMRFREQQGCSPLSINGNTTTDMDDWGSSYSFVVADSYKRTTDNNGCTQVVRKNMIGQNHTTPVSGRDPPGAPSRGYSGWLFFLTCFRPKKRRL